MSNYTPITNFQAKDALASGNPQKVAKGTDITNELNAIAAAIATKYDATILAATAQIFFASGAANLPSISFNAAQSTGLYLAAANSLGLAANGVGAVEIISNGETYVLTPPGATAPPAGMFQVGYLDEPQHFFSTNTTLALSDRGKQMLTFVAGLTLTIPDHGSVAFPIGTIIRIVCLPGGTSPALTIVVAAGSTDTLVWLPSGTSVTGGSGSRSLTGLGACTIEKTSTNQWIITGVGLT